MKKNTLEDFLEQAQGGSSSAREELIHCHKPFIAKVSSTACKRYLSWENDDELSVALLAFNEAIDRYERGNGASFHTFARKIISRKLVDFFRKESTHRNISLSPMEPDEELSGIDKKNSFENYNQCRQEESFAEVVNSFNEVLKEYRISLSDLVRVSPKHKYTKESLVGAAHRLAESPQMLEYLYNYKQLPLKELAETTGLSRRVLEKGRKYIVTVALIISCPQFRPLKNFTQLTIENRN